MTDDEHELEPLRGLPPGLSELDRELRDLHVAERPSFAPELEAELEEAWHRGPPPRPGFGRRARRVLAAGLGALFLVGLAVPPARASLVRLLGIAPEPEPAPSAGPAVLAAPEPAPLDPGLFALPAPEPRPAATETVPPPRAEPAAAPARDWEEPTLPELVDRRSDERLIRRYYPAELQREGVGGTVQLLLWVDASGAVDHVQLREGSGVPELDRAGLLAARELRFTPARSGGHPVGTWVQFDLIFHPRPIRPPTPDVALPSGLEDLSDIAPPWTGVSAVVPAPARVEARELLERALGDAPGAARLGRLDDVLAGEPPPGVPPVQWRSDAVEALQHALVRDPDNPAPYLALGRIRRRQGLTAEARRLFDRGIQRVERSRSPGSTNVVADLYHERGRILKDAWMGWRDLGRLPARALSARSCPGAGAAAVDDESPSVPADVAIAWNYLCPGVLGSAFEEAFEPIVPSSDDGVAMREAFRSAVRVVPAHVGANAELLLLLAEEDRWIDLLDGARRFAWASRGHPYALLLSGIALHRLGRSEEAMSDFERAFEGLAPEAADRIRDVGPLLDEERAREHRMLGREARAAAAEAFFGPLDPVLNTDVNEREVEHVARAAYAHLRFGGSDTDPGVVWVRYGRPGRVRALGVGTGLRTEFWDYGPGADVTFSRPAAASRSLDLTPEGAAYVDDVFRTLRHRYGDRARRSFALPGQTARFRGPGGRLEVEIHSEVPRLLATGGADSLDLGLFVLGPRGERLESVRRRIPAVVAPLSFRTPARLDAAEVALELYSPATGQAAAIRSPVVRSAAAGEDRRISDLLLIEAVPRDGRVPGRREATGRALTTDEPGVGPSLGVLFELYDMPPRGYAMRFEVAPAEGPGEVVAVPYLPSGAPGYVTKAARPGPGEASVVSEYATVDLSAVPFGRHVLRVVIEPVGGGAPVRASRIVERR